jgi:hypothetical protein
VTKQRPDPDETDALLDVTRWNKEQADSEYNEDSVTHILEDRSDAEFVEWLPGPPESDMSVARFKVTDVSEDVELVDYSVELSDELIREAAESLPQQ